MVIPDNMEDISNASLAEKVDILTKYVMYMKEQIELWGSQRFREIEELKNKGGQ